MRMPAASRSAISSRRASATWRAVSPSGWSSRRNDQARIVTGPVSMPLTGLAVRLCAYLDQSTVIGWGRDTSPQRIDGRVHRVPIGLHPAVLGDGEAVQMLGKILHHVVAFGLAVHDDIQADLLLQVDNVLDLGLHEADVLGLAQDVPGQLCAASTDVAGLWERADRRGGQERQVKSHLLRGEAIRIRATGEVRGAYADRLAAQEVALDLPLLPTTTIGSFPQTGDIRRSRAQLARHVLSEAEYVDLMQAEIKRVVDLQEEIGLDVIVHGEPERNDMVQYFAEHLDGFAVTKNGWVQSYGTRCTRPSILWGDVSRPQPITVDWSRYAQSLTAKPVKGMLTGPVTILAWSFVRDDQPLGQTARQVALALRDEIADLETAGIRIVQVDEPALRELLPLKRKDHAGYLDWSVGSFRLATSGVRDETQIHTHLCYSEFGVIIDAIRNLDADVTSIEAARSRMDVIADIRASGFDHGIGPGVYDIHSPRVPSVAEVTKLLDTALASIPARQLWVNPDCGLKTRGYAETLASLQNILAATRTVRERLAPSA